MGPRPRAAPCPAGGQVAGGGPSSGIGPSCITSETNLPQAAPDPYARYASSMSSTAFRVCAASGSSSPTGGSWAISVPTLSGWLAASARPATAPPLLPKTSAGPPPTASMIWARSSASISGRHRVGRLVGHALAQAVRVVGHHRVVLGQQVGHRARTDRWSSAGRSPGAAGRSRGPRSRPCRPRRRGSAGWVQCSCCPPEVGVERIGRPARTGKLIGPARSSATPATRCRTAGWRGCARPRSPAVRSGTCAGCSRAPPGSARRAPRAPRRRW